MRGRVDRSIMQRVANVDYDLEIKGDNVRVVGDPDFVIDSSYHYSEPSISPEKKRDPAAEQNMEGFIKEQAPLINKTLNEWLKENASDMSPRMDPGVIYSSNICITIHQVFEGGDKLWHAVSGCGLFQTQLSSALRGMPMCLSIPKSAVKKEGWVAAPAKVCVFALSDGEDRFREKLTSSGFVNSGDYLASFMMTHPKPKSDITNQEEVVRLAGDDFPAPVDGGFCAIDTGIISPTPERPISKSPSSLFVRRSFSGSPASTPRSLSASTPPVDEKREQVTPTGM